MNDTMHRNHPENETSLRKALPLAEDQTQLENKIKELKSICDTLDPYNKIPKQLQLRLKNIGIDDIENPFFITNNLLMMMEDSIELLEKIKKMSTDNNE